MLQKHVKMGTPQRPSLLKKWSPFNTNAGGLLLLHFSSIAQSPSRDRFDPRRQETVTKLWSEIPKSYPRDNLRSTIHALVRLLLILWLFTALLKTEKSISPWCHHPANQKSLPHLVHLEKTTHHANDPGGRGFMFWQLSWAQKKQPPAGCTSSSFFKVDLRRRTYPCELFCIPKSGPWLCGENRDEAFLSLFTQKKVTNHLPVASHAYPKGAGRLSCRKYKRGCNCRLTAVISSSSYTTTCQTGEIICIFTTRTNMHTVTGVSRCMEEKQLLVTNRPKPGWFCF